MSPVPVTVDCYILDTGYCLASTSLLIQGGPRQPTHCHALVALLKHPTRGWLLWDTGYAPRMLTTTAAWPYRLYRLVTPLRIRPDQSVAAQLTRQGIALSAIQTVMVSHFHADHVAGLLDFPAARIVVDRAGYTDAAARTGLNALRRGVIPALLPADLPERALWLDHLEGPELPGLGACTDLFDDGSLLLTRLPGHARGQVGLLANTSRGPLLFAADGAWLTQSIREVRPPARLTRLMVDQPEVVKITLENLHRFAAARPDVRILPTHCPEARAWSQAQAVLPPDVHA